MAVFAFWLVATRRNQPTWAAALAATAILVSASAVAVYVDWLCLRPRYARRGRWIRYASGLIALLAAITFATVPLIQLVYDAAGIPTDIRFGYWTNVALEAAWYSVHVAVAAVVRAVATRRSRSA